MLKYAIKSIIFVLVLSSIIITPFVYSDWKYSISTQINSSNNLNDVLFNEIEWVLPEDVLVGESHKDIMGSIVDSGSGLNTPNSLINNAIQDRLDQNYTTIGSMGVVQGGNLKKYFATEASKQVEFVIEILSEELYYFYTFKKDDLSAARNQEGVLIQVFRTILEKIDGVWVATSAAEGYAETQMYDADKGKKSLSIDVTSWQKGSLAQQNQI